MNNMSNKKYDNAKQNLVGKVGEEKVIELLKKISSVVRIDDVSDISAYQLEDVDLLVYCDVDGKQKLRKIEIKTDERAGETGNFFVEKSIHYLKDIHDEEGNLIYEKGQIRQGWLYASKADWFFWYVPGNKKIYACSAKQLRRYVQKYCFRTVTCNDGYKVIQGYIVPIEKLCEKCKVWQWDVE